MEQQFNELYEQNNKYVGYLLRNIYSYEDREELAQQVWLTVGQKMDKIEEGKEKAFIKRVTGNIIGNYITKSKKREEMMKNYKELVELAFRYDNTAAYFEVMNELQDRLQEWQFQYVLGLVRGVPQEEIAKHLGIPQAKVSLNMRRAIQAAQYVLAEG